MSGRCKSCDCVLTDDEMRLRDGDGQYTFICSECYTAACKAEQEKDDLGDNDFFYEGRKMPHKNYE